MRWKWIKRLITGLLTYLGVLDFLSAQNLVSNANFEVLKKPLCGYLIFKFGDSTAQNIGDYIQNWYSPTGGTTDPWYYNDTLDIGSTPAVYCTQNLKRLNVVPHSGRHCIGIANSVLKPGTNPTIYYREYIQTRLQSPLRIGTVYNVEYYVRRNPEAGTASNNISLLFTKEPVELVERNVRNFGNLLARQPQIEQKQIISSSTQWTRVSGCFRADSAYQYVTLGNFADDQHTEFLAFPNYGYQSLWCYYLIDDVSVTESTLTVVPSVINLGRDTVLCPNVKFTVNLPTQPGATYRWQDGNNSANYTIHRSGTYWVESKAGDCMFSDTIKVRYEKPLTLPSDTTICSEEPLWLRPNFTTGSLLWSDNSQQDSLSIRQTDSYWVKNINSACLLSDTIRVEVVDCPGQIPNVFTPNGDGKNEKFFIKNVQTLSWRLQIYNRWGKQVYNEEPYQNEWDGAGLPVGLYYYYLSNQRFKRSSKGWIELIR